MSAEAASHAAAVGDPVHGEYFLANVVTFARALRRAGVGWTLPQLEALLDALALLGLASRGQVRDAARACLVGRHEDGAVFEQLFALFFRAEVFAPRREIDLGAQLRRALRREERVALPAAGSDDGDLPEVEADVVERQRQATALEQLRQKDFAQLSDAERRQVIALLLAGSLRLPPRRSRRRRIARRGVVSLRQTLRASLRRGAEPIELLRQQRRRKPRPLVVLCDVSGSMELYARILLPFLYTLRGATDRLEAFAFATRLTRLTRELRHRDVDEALRLAAGAIRDWGGGTRIGESLKAFNYLWGRRVLGRGAVVLVLSDGWDRGDRELLARETARLRRSCHRLIWLNPLLGSEGYEPIAGGIRAILPHVHDFLPVHDLRSLEDLAEVLRKL
jgi:uncharacterized protein with von Willebrand factor type A (vWA) domain